MNKLNDFRPVLVCTVDLVDVDISDIFSFCFFVVVVFNCISISYKCSSLSLSLIFICTHGFVTNFSHENKLRNWDEQMHRDLKYFEPKFNPISNSHRETEYVNPFKSHLDHTILEYNAFFLLFYSITMCC